MNKSIVELIEEINKERKQIDLNIIAEIFNITEHLGRKDWKSFNRVLYSECGLHSKINDFEEEDYYRIFAWDAIAIVQTLLTRVGYNTVRYDRPCDMQLLEFYNKYISVVS